MSETKLYENLKQLDAGIKACLEKRLITPSLILLYSAIDITSWLASDNPYASVCDYFTAWVKDYMLSSKPLGCTALELYSARCGLVHTLTPDSRLVEQKGVRRIAYAWGTGKSTDLQRLIDRTGWSDRLVSVHVEELYESWRLGLTVFMKVLQENSQKTTAVYQRAAKFFDYLAPNLVDEFLSKDESQAKTV